MGGLHKPVYGSLKEFVEAEDVDQSAFDFKLQLDQELWAEHFKALGRGDMYTRVKNKKAYEISAEEMRACSIASEDPIERFWAYKKGCKKCTFDCDGTADDGELEIYINWLMREIYRTLWGWRDEYDGKEAGPMEKSVSRYGRCRPEYAGAPLSVKMGPDTMNSMWMPLSAYLILKYGDLFKWYRNTYVCREAEERGLTLPELIKKHNLVIDEEVKKYAGLTHAMGNMVLVPAGFNSYRGTSGRLKDYWDLSLEDLRESDRLPEGAFVSYINVFFLWDYVNQDGTSRKFFDRKDGNVFPARKEDCVSFFEKVNGCILRRGKFMHQMLRTAQESQERYQEIIRRFSEEKEIMNFEKAREMAGFVYQKEAGGLSL